MNETELSQAVRDHALCTTLASFETGPIKLKGVQLAAALAVGDHDRADQLRAEIVKLVR